jgi:hypothetical protein
VKVNEYVFVDWKYPGHNYCLVHYEPLEQFPIAKGTLVGTIFNGSQRFEFFEHNGRLLSDKHQYWLDVHCPGYIDLQSGEMKIRWRWEPSEEHYLFVSYRKLTETYSRDWLREGF